MRAGTAFSDLNPANIFNGRCVTEHSSRACLPSKFKMFMITLSLQQKPAARLRACVDDSGHVFFGVSQAQSDCPQWVILQISTGMNYMGDVLPAFPMRNSIFQGRSPIIRAALYQSLTSF
jgi:hypothetical protein